MEKDKTCNALLKDIISELENVKSNSINISNKLSTQTDALENISKNLDDVAYETEVSKWQLNYIESTFGKLYRKLHNYPIRENATNFAKLFNIKTRLFGLGITRSTLENNEKNIENKHKLDDTTQKNNSIEKTEEDILLDRVNNIVHEIKEINLINNNEIKKQNLTLDYNNEVTENSQHRIIRNTKKINKLLE